MPIPEYQALNLPLLRLLADGEVHHVAELREHLAEQFNLTESERAEMQPSGGQRLFDNRVAWARTDLGQAGALKSPARGRVQITDRGRSILAEDPQKVERQLHPHYAS